MQIRALSAMARLKMSDGIEDISVWYQDSFTDGGMGNQRRRPVIAGNWKLNPTTAQEAKTMSKLLASNFVNHDRNDVEVVVFPPDPFISTVIGELEGTGNLYC
jgi:hypothetical protein